MPHSIMPGRTKKSINFSRVYSPIEAAMIGMPQLESKCNRPLKMTFEDHYKALIYFHLEEHHSARHLIQVLKEDDFARNQIAPKGGIEKSSFSEATTTRGLEQFMYIFENLQAQASGILPQRHPELGKLIAIDGSLVDATLSMYWADYRKNSKKAKVHVGFDLNQSIPRKVFLTDGNGAERPFVSKIIKSDETSVTDRGYQSHKQFDQLQKENKKYICRIKAGTQKTIIEKREITGDSIVFFDAIVLLGTLGNNQTEEPLRLVGYQIEKVKYWIATNRYDLSAEQIAAAYKLRWNIEKFFAWWKRHLKVYHLIARNEHGLMIQILAGLITYLLLAIYCHQEYSEPVSIKRVRELRIQIQNELRCTGSSYQEYLDRKNSAARSSHAKT